MFLTTAEKVIMHMRQELRFQAQRVIKGVYKKHSFFFCSTTEPAEKLCISIHHQRSSSGNFLKNVSTQYLTKRKQNPQVEKLGGGAKTIIVVFEIYLFVRL